MSNEFFTNTERDFSSVKKIIGAIGKPNVQHGSDPIPEDCYLFKEESDTGQKTFFLKKLDTRLFLLKKYWYFAVPLFILSLLFVLYTPVYAILVMAGMELFLHYLNPFTSITKASRGLTIIRWLSVVMFLVSGYYLFRGLENIDLSLQISQTLLFSTILVYARFNIQGIANKYREIYLLVEDCFSELDDSGVFVWRKQL